MNYLKQPVLLILALSAIFLLSGWGSGGHYLINRQAPASLPGSMQFLKAGWAIVLAEHASDADIRKSEDPDERPKHYIDIDNYPEFVANGKIPMDFDSVIALHGDFFIFEQGIVPWATITAVDSLCECFKRGNWEKAVLTAADLGHYVADAHQPLHLTRNYDGQYTDQEGVHYRYESRLFDKYQEEILIAPDSVSYVENVPGFVFGYIYSNYKVLDSLLLADSLAHAEAGNTESNKYYQIFWEASKQFTNLLFNQASHSLAALIYTAWVDAGSPVMPANALEDMARASMMKISIFPNPFTDKVMLTFRSVSRREQGMLQVYDNEGKLVRSLGVCSGNSGDEITFDATGLAPGCYYFRLVTPSGTAAARAFLFK